MNETAVLLNDAGKQTKVYSKKRRNQYQFPVLRQQTEEENNEKYTLKLFKNIPVKPMS